MKPSHLFLGTHIDNMRDMVSKGRDAGTVGSWNGGPSRPEKAHLAKITSMEMAEEIRRVFRETGMSKVAIAQMFGVSDCTIRDVVKYRTWIPDRWKK